MTRGGADDIFQASKKGDLARVKEFVEAGADVNAKNTHRETALMVATHKNHIDIVKYLVEKGADMNVKNVNGVTALIVATFNDRIDIVKYLVEKGAHMNAKDSHGYTALMLGTRENHIDIVKYLVEKGADVNVQNDRGETACDEASSAELKSLLCPPRIPPVPTEERNIPAGSEKEITYEEIKNGDVLVDFNKEYQHKRYYDHETVSKLRSNPHTREPIGKKTVYTAKIVAGGKRKTRRNVLKKRTKKIKKTRKQ